MSLAKAIKHRKEHRAPLRRGFAPTCRPHGSCAWCSRSRLRHVRQQFERERIEREAMAADGPASGESEVAFSAVPTDRHSD